MNKKITIITLGVVASAAIGVGGVVFIAKSNLEKREQALSAQIDKLKGNLPSQFKVESIPGERGLFESKGKYIITHTDKDLASYNSKVSVDYQASHGFDAWFGGDIQFIAKGKVEGEIVKTLQIKSGKTPGMEFEVKGLLKEDGSITSKNTTSDFSLVVPKPVHTPAPEPVAVVAPGAEVPPAVEGIPSVPGDEVGAVSEVPSTSLNAIAKGGLVSNLVPSVDAGAVTGKAPEATTAVAPTAPEVNAATPTEAQTAPIQEAAKEPVKEGPTGMLVTFKGITGTLNFVSKTGAITTHDEVKSIVAEDLEDANDKIVGNNISLDYDSNVKNIEIGTFKLKAAKLSNGTEMVKAEGLEIMAGVEEKSNKYNVKFNAQAKSVTVMNQKDVSFEVGYSVNGIDRRMMEIYKKAASVYASNGEFSETDTAEAKKVLIENVQSGLSFNIDKIKFKNGANLMDFSGKYEIVPTPQDKTFTFLGQSKITANLEAEGEFAMLANSLLGSVAGEAVQEQADPSKFKFNFAFENGGLKINDKVVESGMSESIANSLKSADAQFGLVKVEDPVVEVPVDPNAAPVEATPAPAIPVAPATK